VKKKIKRQMNLETKFYIFFNFSWSVRKCIDLMISEKSNNNNFLSFKKLDFFFKKNVQFHFQAYFNIEITLNSGIDLLNLKMRDIC
jgi:hypothetical protein